MPDLHRLEGATPYAGGALIVWPSKYAKEIAWHSATGIRDAQAFAKAQAASLLDELMREGKGDEANGTNWPSLVAALQRIVVEFNERLRAHLRAIPERTQH